MTATLRCRLDAALVAVALIAIFFGGVAAAAGTIDTVRENQTIRIAYRADAPPFSYKQPDDPEPGGYMVNICRAVAKKLGEQLGLPSLKVVYVAVSAANR